MTAAKAAGKAVMYGTLYLIAALAISHNLTLETNDEHFQRLKPLGLKTK